MIESRPSLILLHNNSFSIEKCAPQILIKTYNTSLYYAIWHIIIYFLYGLLEFGYISSTFQPDYKRH